VSLLQFQNPFVSASATPPQPLTLLYIVKPSLETRLETRLDPRPEANHRSLVQFGLKRTELVVCIFFGTISMYWKF
ncbi:hypothetical protein Tsubulata_010093, partial [Turnera subulata]